MLYLRHHCLAQDHEDLLLFSSVSFLVLAFTCRSLIRFEFIFVYDMKKGSNLILLPVKLFQHHSLRLFFPLLNYLGTLLEIQLTINE